MSPEEALGVLREAMKTQKGRAALDVVETELQAGGGAREKSADSPRRMPSKDKVAAFLGGRDSARGKAQS